MEKTLNITNGDCAVNVMRQAGVEGDFLPWRDVLHEGKVPSGLSLSALSEVRAEFIAGRGWGELEKVKADFIVRDNCLKNWQEYSKIILWFEHDLYDQLQLIQILDWFAGQPLKPKQLTLICTEKYLGVQKESEIAELFVFEEAVNEQQLNLAQTAWQAFRAETPQLWAGLLQQDTSVLPFLQGAIVRLLEEYPSCSNGLSRTQQQVLNILSIKECKLDKLFELYAETEQRVFLGDLSFCHILEQMLKSSPPAIMVSSWDGKLQQLDSTRTINITEFGRKILRREGNWLASHQLDLWLGGVHLAENNHWCWDGSTERLIQIK